MRTPFLTNGENMLKIYLIAIAAISVIAFFVYGIDKIKAIRGTFRISERTLLLLGFFGGGAGAIAAMQLFRHKTRHWYFYAINILGLAWQVAVLIMIMIYK